MSKAHDQIRAFVRQVEALESDIATLNHEKRDVYKEAKEAELDVTALRAVIAYRRKREAKGAEELDAAEGRFAEYLHVVEEAEPRARARARETIEEFSSAPGLPPHDPHTGEV